MQVKRQIKLDIDGTITRISQESLEEENTVCKETCMNTSLHQFFQGFQITYLSHKNQIIRILLNEKITGFIYLSICLSVFLSTLQPSDYFMNLMFLKEFVKIFKHHNCNLTRIEFFIHVFIRNFVKCRLCSRNDLFLLFLFRNTSNLMNFEKSQQN